MPKEFYGFEKLSLVDVDGLVSCTVFTGGCNFRCPFCHNATLVLDFDNCETYDFNEIMDYLKLRKKILEAVVVTGGEPTLLVGLKSKLRQIKELGYYIKFDSNGTNLNVVKELVEEKLIDYVAMDIKNCKDRYNETIGLEKYDFSRIQASIDYLKENHIDYEFRTTLVKEFHTLEDIQKMGELIKGAKRFFLQKFEDHDNCIQSGFHAVPLEEAKEFKKILDQYCENVAIRNYE